MNHRKTIRFVLDGEIVEVGDVDPTRTVLQYLREDLGRHGTKEGCAEGDCGACTVVIAEADGRRLRARSVNACIQFLPTLDGRELVTVESLQDETGALHPVQSAMLECHGSQCGFCTPGFVMSLFALYKNDPAPDRRAIDDALAGNLCRCTGYRPIVDAALQMYVARHDGAESWLRRPAGDVPGKDEAHRAAMLDELRSNEPLHIRGCGRQYFAPTDVAGLARLCSEHPDATLLAGGTDVGLWVTKQHRDLTTVIYTGNVTELQRIEKTKTHLQIGAAVSLTDAMAEIIDCYPALEEMFLRFASPPIRNAGTLGGNVANGSPIGDSMPALLVLGASVSLHRGNASRVLPLDDFYIDYMKNELRPGEFLEKIVLPLPDGAERIACYKISKRFDQDISAVCGAFYLVREGDIATEVRVAFGGMAAIPKRASACEEALTGKPWNEASIADGSAALQADFTAISDMRATAAYRQQVAANLLRRFYLETSGSTAGSVYAFGR